MLGTKPNIIFAVGVVIRYASNPPARGPLAGLRTHLPIPKRDPPPEVDMSGRPETPIQIFGLRLVERHRNTRIYFHLYIQARQCHYQLAIQTTVNGCLRHVRSGIRRANVSCQGVGVVRGAVGSTLPSPHR